MQKICSFGFTTDVVKLQIIDKSFFFTSYRKIFKGRPLNSNNFVLQKTST